MATINLTSAQANTGSLVGVNVDPMVWFDWDLKALAASAAAGDVLVSPTIDLNATAPKTNRVVGAKACDIAAPDTIGLYMSADGTNWYQMPLFNGGTGGGGAISSVSVADLSLHGIPGMRYIRAQITLGTTAMSGRTRLRFGLSLMRF